MNGAGFRGIFIAGTDTDVGKTHFACRFLRALRLGGVRVGCAKPVASGCPLRDGVAVSQDAELLWEAAGRPETVADVCPQAFVAPVAPPLAASWEGKRIDRDRLTAGIDFWRSRCDFLLVEGAGGILSPIDDAWDNLDLAAHVALPVLLVAPNRVGTVNQVRMAIECLAGRRIPLLGIVLNRIDPTLDPRVAAWNRETLARIQVPMLLDLGPDDDLAESLPWVHLHPELRERAEG